MICFQEVDSQRCGLVLGPVLRDRAGSQCKSDIPESSSDTGPAAITVGKPTNPQKVSALLPPTLPSLFVNII